MAFKMSGFSAFTKKPPVDETPEEAIKRLKKDKRHSQGEKAKAWLTGDKEYKEAMQEDIDHHKKLIEQQEIARDQDPGTGETKQEQHLSEIKAMEGDLKRITEKAETQRNYKKRLIKRKKITKKNTNKYLNKL